jgi:Ca2+/Na+ antiporter
MYIFELIFLILLFSGIMLYRNYKGQNVGKFITEQVQTAYDKFAPYSFKMVREKTKELGQEYTPRQYMIQVTVMEVFTAVVTYLYFYNILISLIYMAAVLMVVPYLAYLRCKRVYSEFIFEQIQTYTSNTIMEFATTQSFVKALEGVVNSGILEDPVKSDVQHMIDLSYQNGTIDESLTYMSQLYPYFIVKNMHQLFLQITKEGAQNSMDSLDNMQLDIDMLVESVYRDRIERQTFHKQFLYFGVMLYLMVMLVQYLLGTETYLNLLQRWYIQFLLHGVLIINSYFLLKGEKYYNENVGAE